MVSDKSRLRRILRWIVIRADGGDFWAVDTALDELCEFLNIEFDKNGDITSICGKEL